MSDIKTLRAYAEGRRLPTFRLLAELPTSWIDYAYDLYTKTPVSSDLAKDARERTEILGTRVDGYDSLTEYYNQSCVDQIFLHESYEILVGAHNFRFGTLKHGSAIPMHIDEPFSLRGICVIRGSHKFVFENGDMMEMFPGELYFINGCYRHSVENSSDIDRVALLNNFTLNEHNLSLIKQ